MNRSAACLLAPSALFLFLACSGSAPGADGTGGAGTGGNQATGATGSGGTDGDGGAQQASGGTTNGSGGAQGTGGRGDLAPNECTDTYACGTGATCYAPGESTPAICGAPQWCGQCSCPAMLPVPEGSGQPCGEQDQCPVVTDTILRAASVCDPEAALCSECLANEDCSENLPYCDTEGTSGARMCFQCADDADCGGETPICFKLAFPGPNAFGMCRECQTSADCVAGICDVNGACVPGCQSSAQCGPNRICVAERCEPQPCADDSACSSQSTCNDDSCRPIDCTNDADCAPGYCTKGGCYETPGGCMFDTAG